MVDTALAPYVEALQKASATGYRLPDVTLAQVRTALRGAAPVFASLSVAVDDATPARANGHLVIYTENHIASVAFTRMPAAATVVPEETLGVFTIEVAPRYALTGLSLLFESAAAGSYPAGDLTLAHSARLVLTYVGLSGEVVITKDHAGEYDLDALYGALLEDLS